jgi:hypothetical protein
MSELTAEERRELRDRAKRLHRLYDLGGAYQIGEDLIDWVQGAGLWIHRDGLLYSNNTRNPHADICVDPDQVREVLAALRKTMILEDLADV